MEIIYTDRKILEDSKKTKFKKKTILLWILVPIIIIIIIALIAGIIYALVPRKKNEDPDIDYKTQKIEPPPEIKPQKLKKEFEIVTIPEELRRIFVTQKIKDETNSNGKSFVIETIRKTYYDIYIISEEEATEENKLFYSKLYTAAISIVSECYSLGQDDCEPEKMVELSVEKKEKNNNTKVLNNIEDYKDLPIPLCTFQITDNNFILSITCPESFSKPKKNEILLDLYFFRPPAIERADKKKNNITVIIDEDKKKNRKYIRENNKGLCNIRNNFDTFCTTEMNTTTDLEGNLLSYDEFAVTNITTDENNYYIRKKLTNLIDETDKTENLDVIKYKKSLDKLLYNLAPYMKEDIKFTTENFTEIYNIIHKNEKLVSKKKKPFRNLLEHFISQTNEAKEANLFYYNYVGIPEISYNLVNDPGVKDGEVMQAFSNLGFDNNDKELVNKAFYTNISYIIDKISVLSKAGNTLSTELYNNLKEKLNNITKDISDKINKLATKVKYYDILEIFDSTSSLPSIKNISSNIVTESDNLINSLKNFHNNLEIGNLKDLASEINFFIHNFIIQSHSDLRNIFDNLKELGNILGSNNNKITEITTYYLNHTSSSYVDIIQNAQNILENYYINEKNLILSNIDELLNSFEQNMYSALEIEIKKIDFLYTRLLNGSYSMESGNEENKEKLLLNLENSKSYISNIINKVKQFIKGELGLKDNDYFISNKDLQNNNNSFTGIILKSKEVSKKLDNDEMIDKIFDEIMSNFRQNYTNIIKYLNQEKLSKFALNEEVLENSLFTPLEKDNIEDKMKILRATVVNKINEENNYYLKNLGTNISEFINEDLGQLKDIISDLDINYFSDDSLNSLKNSFEEAFHSCLNKVLNDIKSNELLSKEYFDNIYKAFNDNEYLKNLISSYKTKEIPEKAKFRPFIFKVSKDFKKFEDTIKSKEKTKAYLKKYNEYISNFEYSKKYLIEDLYLDIFSLYKTALTNIRTILQSIKNNKITDKYPDFKELNFYNTHIKTIDKLFNRLNKYISDNIFNDKYIPQINSNIKEDENYINSVESNIISKHNSINILTLNSDNINDFCFNYERKMCYGCTNCDWYNTVEDSYCFPLSEKIKNNHLKLIKSEIKSDDKLKIFQNKINDFTLKISEKINFYNSKIINLEKKLISVKLDTLNRNITKDYLTPFGNLVNSLLSEKYGDEIIKSSYNYYQKIIEERLGNILNNASFKLNKCYDELISEVKNNEDNFKSTTYEFGLMAQSFETIITQNITKNYFESIESFQKNEFNYTITYYYNYLSKIINEGYQYIISSIPINKNGFNDIKDLRESEIKENFNLFINNINNSFNSAISIKRQKYVLLVSEDDFFNIGNIVSDNIIETSKSLKDKYLYLYDFGTEGDKYSVVSRYYLENSINGKQIEQFYSSVNDNTFVDLSLYKFENLLVNNWIFDRREFILKLNESLLTSNREIENNLISKNDTYSEDLEEEIIRVLKNESIENKISKFYSSEIIDLDANNITMIKEYINEILDNIKIKIINEVNILNTTATSYNNDYSKILNTINGYKVTIFNNLNSTIFNVLDGFYSNMIKNAYEGYIEDGLNNYTKIVKNGTSQSNYCQDFHLLNSTYKIGEIINDLLLNIVNEYKDKAKKTIDNKYKEYYLRIKNLINLDELQNSIIKELNISYNSILLPALNKYAIYNKGEMYSEYDFNDDIKNEINLLILNNTQNIKKIISFTKGSNYEVDIFKEWEIMSFPFVKNNKIIPMCESFYNYLNFQKKEQSSQVTEFINNRIISNFNDLLNNVIPSFGKQFFERIIKYNENFKISSLYDNLRFSLSETLLYYVSLGSLSDIDALPKDLQIRLFNLNDLDITVSNKNKKILKTLENKVNDFIKDSQKTIINSYYLYLQNDAQISQSFSTEIMDKINSCLNLKLPDMGDKYINMLQQYLKDKLIKSYTKIMNDKTDEMVLYVQNKKEILKSTIGDFFSLDSDQILNDVNQKINFTLEAIKTYNEHFNTFNFSNDIIEFLNNYGNLYVQPLFKSFKTELNKATKDKILENIDKNSKNIENLNSEQFNSQINDYYSFFNTNYINNISEYVNLYGSNFDNLLDKEMEKKNNNLRRRLEGTQTEEEMAEESKTRILDQGIEENFQKILNSLNNVKINFETSDAFNDLEKKISNNIQKINEKYKETKILIEENDYEENITIYLNDKLTNLTNISNEYYYTINKTYNELKNYLNQSIEDIYNKVNSCANITYKVFNQKFEKIVNKTDKSNNKSFSDTSNYTFDNGSFIVNSEHISNSVNASIIGMLEKAEFKFDIYYKGENIKKLYILASIINRIRPNKALIDISPQSENCSSVVHSIDIEFKEVNFTMDIYYDSESNKINISVFTFFEEYYYNTKIYTINSTKSNTNINIPEVGSMNVPSKCKDIKKTVICSDDNIPYKELKDNYTYIFDA